jgi:hypothetical protein
MDEQCSNLHRARICRIIANIADNSERPICFTQRSRARRLLSFFLRLGCIQLRRCSCGDPRGVKRANFCDQSASNLVHDGISGVPYKQCQTAGLLQLQLDQPNNHTPSLTGRVVRVAAVATCLLHQKFRTSRMMDEEF